jgi:hypothetical protein
MLGPNFVCFFFFFFPFPRPQRAMLGDVVAPGWEGGDRMGALGCP